MLWCIIQTCVNFIEDILNYIEKDQIKTLLPQFLFEKRIKISKTIKKVSKGVSFEAVRSFDQSNYFL